MDFIGVNLALFFGASLLVSLIYNFISIHTMANLVLYEGSSWQRSFSISTEFAILTSVFMSSFVVLGRLIGGDISLGPETIFYGAIGGSGLLVEMIRVWYVGEVYDTILLYSFVIAESFNIFLAIIFIMLSNTFLGVI